MYISVAENKLLKVNDKFQIYLEKVYAQKKGLRVAFLDAYFKLACLHFEDYIPIREKLIAFHKMNPNIVWNVIVTQFVQSVINTKGSKFVVISSLTRLLKKLIRLCKDLFHCSDEEFGLMLKEKAKLLERDYMYEYNKHIERPHFTDQYNIFSTSEFYLNHDREKFFIFHLFEEIYEIKHFNLRNYFDLIYKPPQKIQEDIWYEGQWSKESGKPEGVGIFKYFKKTE